ncbi:zincin-like metallopeptidase domain-containing protein [uncultured Cohaesibacter sp.]|uniref:ArdC family protein n=1 Tax=uncultured Cohaesibacter sp. TaxID=1002546 RepID=UPI002AA7F53C|nr:zincin-like metallopeptidase domain-containing protein [uncultured Cohaesibacter sp.]
MAKRDIYQEITDKIINVLEKVDLNDYQPPFASLAAQGLPTNPVTGNRYNGINIPSLWFDQQEKGFASNHWATFKQWQERGAQVRKGEKSSPIIFYKTLVKEAENKKGETEEYTVPMLKTYAVFNADQVDGYEHGEGMRPHEEDRVTRLENAEEFCAATAADIRHGGNKAFYRCDDDFIQMPETRLFVDTKQATATENYYSTLLHELTHWTGAPQRLDRDKAKTSQERDKYAFEELIAELGAAFLCSALGIVQTPRDDHALYIKSWLQALQNDKKHIFKASAQAAKACDYLSGLQSQTSAQDIATQ